MQGAMLLSHAINLLPGVLGSPPSCFPFALLSLPPECRGELWGAVVWEAEGTSKGFTPCRGSSGVAEGH